MLGTAGRCDLTFVNAFATNFHEFYILRMVAGVGVGAEGEIIAPYLAEFVGSRYRGRFTGALAGFFSFGFVLSALLGYLVVPTGPNGWRYLMIIAALPVVFLLWMRRALFESPRWLEEMGRHGEAARVCEAIEKHVERATGQPLPAPQKSPGRTVPSGATGHTNFFGRLAVLFKPQYLTTTIVVWALWIAVIFCYYAFLVWIPSLLVAKGFTVTRSFSFTILIYLAQIPGYYSAAYLNDKIGRKYTIVVYMLVACLAALGLPFATGDTEIVLYSMLLSFGMNGVIAGQYRVGRALVGFTYTNTRFEDVVRTSSTPFSGTAAFNNFEALATYNLTPAFMLGASYDYTKAESAKYLQLNVGALYNLSKRTLLYATTSWERATGIDSTGKAAVAALTFLTPSSTGGQVAVRAGIRHNF
ncbi:MFS transporter [Burkholderia sp. Bp8998]|uniref:MFS transporter n=1 Tax=Burkholderia sp. Bp8998 TaxID=2184557 RepID=UPI000F5A53A0|nr:MFS transporter [Burkholderia sp. Bp8998]RQS14509.1 MFS transporter [Burkholderia sp. Bp8998]